MMLGCNAGLVIIREQPNDATGRTSREWNWTRLWLFQSVLRFWIDRIRGHPNIVLPLVGAVINISHWLRFYHQQPH